MRHSRTDKFAASSFANEILKADSILQAHQQLCKCRLCQNPPVKKLPAPLKKQPFMPPTNSVMRSPDCEHYMFVLEQLSKMRLRDSIKINIPQVFFLKDSKIISFFFNSEKGQISKYSGYIGIKQAETILLNKNKRSEKEKQNDEIKESGAVTFTSMSAKTERSNKIKNEVGLIRFHDGRSLVLNEFNLHFELQKSRNISSVQMHFPQVPFVYNFSLQNEHQDPLFLRSKTYVLVLKGDIDFWNPSFISRDMETKFHHTLYLQSPPKLYAYLSMKIVNLLLVGAYYKVWKANFQWVVDFATAAVFLSNVQAIEYTVEPKLSSKYSEFMAMRHRNLENKLKILQNTKAKKFYEFSHRINKYEDTLNTDYLKIKSQLKEVPLADQKFNESEYVFKKLHPNVQHKLNDILKDQRLFTETVGSIINQGVAIQSSAKRNGRSLSQNVEEQYDIKYSARNAKQYTTGKYSTAQKSRHDGEIMTPRKITTTRRLMHSERKRRLKTLGDSEPEYDVRREFRKFVKASRHVGSQHDVSQQNNEFDFTKLVDSLKLKNQ